MVFEKRKASKHLFYGVWCKIGENKRNRTLVNSLVLPLSHVMLHVLRSTHHSFRLAFPPRPPVKIPFPLQHLSPWKKFVQSDARPERVRIRTGRAGNVG